FVDSPRRLQPKLPLLVTAHLRIARIGQLRRGPHCEPLRRHQAIRQANCQPGLVPYSLESRHEPHELSWCFYGTASTGQSGELELQDSFYRDINLLGVDRSRSVT